MNQKDIAKALKISQSTVSLSLRGDRSISPEIRKKVQKAAKKMGYHPNAYLTVLMSNIRRGKNLTDKGIIALLIEAGSQDDWYKIDSYRVFHEGAIQRGRELGFNLESFFLKQPDMNSTKIGRILDVRGIKGIILAPPYHGNRTLDLSWEHYASIGVGFGWEEQDLNRVVFADMHNYITAFNQLREMGYKRIGTVLGKKYVMGNRHGLQWYNGYLDCQNSIVKTERIPVLTTQSTSSFWEPLTDESARILKDEFHKWILKWKPDVVLTLVGEQKAWLESMNFKVPQDIGLACLSRPSDCDYAGIDDRSEAVGAAAVELVAAQIARNEFGLPTYFKTTMIEGRWINGTTAQVQNKKSVKI